MNYKMNMHQAQRLSITSDMKQSLEILQLPSLVLHSFLQQEMNNNPLLELEIEGNTLEGSTAEADLIDWEGFFTDTYNYDNDHNNEIAQFNTPEISVPVGLKDHLTAQLSFADLNPRDRKTARYIIDNIDENGYLLLDSKALAKEMAVVEEKIECIVKTIQSLDPPGVGARTLSECLLLQLKEQGAIDGLAAEIVRHYLNEVAENKIKYIASKTGTNPAAVQEAVDCIKLLEPKPGRLFGSNRNIQYIMPDVTIKQMDGAFIVLVSDTCAPHLRVNNLYKKMLANPSDIDRDTINFLQNNFSKAVKLIRSIEDRKSTIYMVASEILSSQYNFFKDGPMHLKRLTQADIAQKLGIHESTVSRTVNGKYMDTPRGIYEFKYFFQSGINDTQKRAVSSESVKRMLRSIIEDENKNAPYSDQAITRILSVKGIDVSRRTVAGYRSELGIPPASKRKRY